MIDPRKWTAFMALIAAIAIAFSVYSTFALLASNVLLDKIATVRPGVNLSSFKEELGLEMYKISDLDYMVQRGSIKDRLFCQGKILHIFYASTPPYRALEVYTDATNVVVYVSWKQL